MTYAHDDTNAPTIGHNNPPEPTPFELITTQINDLYDTAKDFADGEPIATQEMHDTIEKIHTQLHEAGKAAEAARVEEKKPLDLQIKAIQDRYLPLIGDTTKVKGKVPLGKEVLAALMQPWRVRVQREKEAVAAAAKAEADRLADVARAAMAASAGNLAEREAAEVLVKEAAAVNRFATAATKGPSGLVSRWIATLVDEEAALDHYYPLYKESFRQLVEDFARADVSLGKRTIPGFRVEETKVVRV